MNSPEETLNDELTTISIRQVLFVSNRSTQGIDNLEGIVHPSTAMKV